MKKNRGCFGQIFLTKLGHESGFINIFSSTKTFCPLFLAESPLFAHFYFCQKPSVYAGLRGVSPTFPLFYYLLIAIKKYIYYITYDHFFVYEIFTTKWRCFMSEATWLNIFSNNLKTMMSEYRYTTKTLSEDTGLSIATINKYIHEKQMPTTRALINIAYAFDCSLDDLMDFGDRIF